MIGNEFWQNFLTNATLAFIFLWIVTTLYDTDTAPFCLFSRPLCTGNCKRTIMWYNNGNTRRVLQMFLLSCYAQISIHIGLDDRRWFILWIALQPRNKPLHIHTNTYIRTICTQTKHTNCSMNMLTYINEYIFENIHTYRERAENIYKITICEFNYILDRNTTRRMHTHRHTQPDLHSLMEKSPYLFTTKYIHTCTQTCIHIVYKR